MKSTHLLYALMLCAMLISGLFGTESRMTALGNPYGFLRDDTDVFRYPGTLNSYNRVLTAELNSPSSDVDWSIGANLPIRSNVLGFYLNRNTGIDIDYANDLNGHSDYTDGNLNISKAVLMLLGFQNKFTLGMAMSIDNSRNEVSDTKEMLMDAHYYELSGGISTDKFDLGAYAYLSGAEINHELSEEVANHDFLGFNVSGRYYLIDDADLSCILLGNLTYDDWKSKHVYPYETNIKVSQNQNIIDFGIGANYKIGKSSTLIAAVKPLRFASRTTTEPSGWADDTDSKLTWRYIFIPEYNLGLEAEITPWLVGRIGAQQDYAFYKYNRDEQGSSADYQASFYTSDFTTNLGLGFKFGKFTLDTVLSKALLFDGPDFIGGNANGIASKVSITAEF